MLFPLLKRTSKYALLCFGALVCQIFIANTLVPLGPKLGCKLALPLLTLAPPGCAAALVIGVLGGLWLRESPWSAYIMSLFLALFTFAFLIIRVPPKLNFLTFLVFSQLPLTTFIGGFVYTMVNAIKSRWSKRKLI